MMLDVGCGNNPRGDVNCDLYIRYSIHLGKNKIIEPKQIPNFVHCDAHFLPFKDNVFDIVHASHLLEHCKHPYLVLTEFKRVSKSKVYIKVPNLEGILFEEHEGHLYTWSDHSLRSLLSQIFSKVEVYNVYMSIRIRFLKKLPFHPLIIRFLQNFLKTELIGVCYK